MTEMLLHARGLCLDAPGGRPLLRELSMAMARERVALIGRNGAGKSTLLRVLAGEESPAGGSVRCTGTRLLVPQELPQTAALSPGERRREALEESRAAAPDLLLLDEPTQDLDRSGIAWLAGWLREWRGGLLVVSHDRRLLRGFDQFCVVAESGCRAFEGGFDALVAELQHEEAARQQVYVRNLNRLAERERHNAILGRRRQRKKNLGRAREVRRRTSRSLLNENRSYAQESQGKRAALQQVRIGAARTWAKATRRALSVQLPLQVALPELPEPALERGPVVQARGLAAVDDRGTTLFHGLSLDALRERTAIRGDNGSGKTTLLEFLTGGRLPPQGEVVRRPEALGYVAQGGANWMLEQSLLSYLAIECGMHGAEAVAGLLTAHRFPFALAERPLATLSPGERVRAALIALFQRRPPSARRVLDEPTAQLDFVGIAALTEILRAYRGGLLIVSHDDELLDAIGIDREIELGRPADVLEQN